MIKANGTDVDFLKEAPNNYSLEGAVYQLYEDANCTVEAKDTSGDSAKLITKANGETNTLEMEPATFYAKEIKASKGFKLDTEVKKFTLTADNDEDNPYVIKSTEDPTWGTFKMTLQKISDKEGTDKLVGTQYVMKYYDIYPSGLSEGSNVKVSESNIAGKTPTRQWLFETRLVKDGMVSTAIIDLVEDEPINASGITSDDTYVEEEDRILPLGIFTLEEYKAPKGLARDTNVYVGVTAQGTKSGGTIAYHNGTDGASVLMNGSDSLDINYDDATLINSDTPQFVEIEAQKKDAETGKAEAQGYATLEGAEFEVLRMPYGESSTQMTKVGTIVTDANGYGKITQDDTVTVGDKGLIPGYYVVRETKAPKGYLLNTKYERINALAEELNTALFTYGTEISDTPTHTLIHKTDVTSGIDELEGATLQIFEGDTIADGQEPLEEWVSGKEPHEIIGLEGTYTLREITAPFGYECAEDVVFTVTKDKVTTEVSMDNIPIELHTTATVDGLHTTAPSEETTIKDVVEYSGLLKDKTYNLTGKLMDKSTGKALLDASGNEITSQVEFTTTDTKGTVELEFKLDTSLLEGTTIVVFEDLYRDGKYLATHADIDDVEQSVGVPEIHTTAIEKQSEGHNVLAGENQTIIDRIAYKGLSPLETYTATGTLYDKTTEELTEYTASTTFKPTATEGTVDVVFEIDSTDMENHVLVAYEVLAVGDIKVATHENPDDEDQTVYVPEIGTQAAIVSKNVTDTVAYDNLIEGQTYVAKGWLVDTKTGRKLKNSDGETEFTADTTTGEVKVVLPLKKYDKLGGYKLTAYEELYIVTTVDGKKTETLVAEHKDLDDTDQTVKVPKAPKTGDSNNMTIYLIGGLGAVALLAGFLVGRKRKTSSKK